MMQDELSTQCSKQRHSTLCFAVLCEHGLTQQGTRDFHHNSWRTRFWACGSEHDTQSASLWQVSPSHQGSTCKLSGATHHPRLFWIWLVLLQKGLDKFCRFAHPHRKQCARELPLFLPCLSPCASEPPGSPGLSPSEEENQAAVTCVCAGSVLSMLGRCGFSKKVSKEDLVIQKKIFDSVSVSPFVTVFTSVWSPCHAPDWPPHIWPSRAPVESQHFQPRCLGHPGSHALFWRTLKGTCNANVRGTGCFCFDQQKTPERAEALSCPPLTSSVLVTSTR